RSETSLTESICAHAVRQDGLFVIPDTTRDSRTADNPLVTGAAGSATRAVRLRPACPSEGMRQTSRRNASAAEGAR
ncbi:MAG: hypothetical protein EOO66_08820, partial [Methylobacterium sp.]